MICFDRGNIVQHVIVYVALNMLITVTSCLSDTKVSRVRKMHGVWLEGTGRSCYCYSMWGFA